MSTLDLFGAPAVGEQERLGPQALVLRGFALPFIDELLPAIANIEAASPFRQMQTPGGYTMSAALSNCGEFGGLRRTDPAARVTLYHGDVVVWGGEDRMRYHGIMPVKGAAHPLLGAQRINFTFRKAG